MKVRQLSSIVKATACEVLSEPLSLLLLLAALALTVLAPAFHYHQFGEATRMARDAGCSSLFLGGGLLAIFTTIRAFRREVETGTLQMALAHPIGRGSFFGGKLLGCALAYGVFATIIFAAMMLMVSGAAIGAKIAAATGTLARLYGPCLVGGLALGLLPLVIAAFLNRFRRVRFVFGTFLWALAFSVVILGTLAILSGALLWRYLPAVLLEGVYAMLLLSASAAAAVRFRANGAASLAAAVVALSVPAIGNYYLADQLSNGGRVAGAYLGGAVLALVPAIAAFVGMGIYFMRGRDI